MRRIPFVLLFLSVADLCLYLFLVCYSLNVTDAFLSVDAKRLLKHVLNYFHRCSVIISVFEMTFLASRPVMCALDATKRLAWGVQKAGRTAKRSSSRRTSSSRVQRCSRSLLSLSLPQAPSPRLSPTVVSSRTLGITSGTGDGSHTTGASHKYSAIG